MGGVSTPGGKGMDVDLNVVPFIDLLSSLVLFLLLGAVWVQISSMKASVEGRGPAAVAASSTPPKRVEVQVTPDGYKLKWPKGAGNRPAAVAKKQGQWDVAGLGAVVKAAVTDGKVDSGAVSATDAAPYGELVTAIDVIKDAGATTVAISTE
jgi:biopolymer transport protein TolR